MEYTQYKSDTSIRIGLTNLLKNEIIARVGMILYISLILWLLSMVIE